MEAKPYLREISLKRERLPELDHYPFCIPAVRELDGLSFHPDVTFFVGENGSGKSTILEAIAMALGLGPEGGTKNLQFSTAETTSALHRHLRIVKSFARPRDYYFLRAESFFNVASDIERLDEDPEGGPRIMPSYGDRSLHRQSHGESFMALLTDKLRGSGLYLFDEPEAALSPSRQMAALAAIHRLVEDGSQFIIATHSPILLAYPRSKIVLFDGSGLSEVRYEDTEHYAITRHFLNNHRKMVDTLMSDD
jgi:predicted ATPase